MLGSEMASYGWLPTWKPSHLGCQSQNTAERKPIWRAFVVRSARTNIATSRQTRDTAVKTRCTASRHGLMPYYRWLEAFSHLSGRSLKGAGSKLMACPSLPWCRTAAGYYLFLSFSLSLSLSLCLTILSSLSLCLSPSVSFQGSDL